MSMASEDGFTRTVPEDAQIWGGLIASCEDYLRTRFFPPLDRRLAPYVVEAVGACNRVALAYIRAGERLSVRPCEVQAATWVFWRRACHRRGGWAR